MNVSRRTEVLRFRQLVLEVIAAAFPGNLNIAVIVASARIKIGKQISIQELRGLLKEMVSENIILEEHNNMYKYNDANQLQAPEFPKEYKKTESLEAKRLRLIQRRVTTFLQRQKQFEQDVQILFSILPSTSFIPNDLISYLPFDWIGRRRKVAYIMQCLLSLLKSHQIVRNEKTGMFQSCLKSNDESSKE